VLVERQISGKKGDDDKVCPLHVEKERKRTRAREKEIKK